MKDVGRLIVQIIKIDKYCNITVVVVLGCDIIMYQNDEHIYFCEGNIPVIITFPHSGSTKIKGVETRKKGVIHGDDHTDKVAKALMNAFACNACSIVNNNNNNNGQKEEESSTICNCSIWKENDAEKEYEMAGHSTNRTCCDFNRSAENAYENTVMKQHHDLYHGTIISFINKAKQLSQNNWQQQQQQQSDDGSDNKPLWSGRCLLLDMHGQSDCPDHILRGTKNMTTVQPLLQRYGVDAIIGDNSIFGGLRAREIPIFPESVPTEYLLSKEKDISSSLPPPPETRSKTSLDQHMEHPRYSGAYTVVHHALAHSIDCIQVEIGFHYRLRPQVIVDLTRRLRDSILTFNKTYLIPPS
ncbi:hypothetical protein DFA_08119 [Cavenderia fasciculata]|uniref:N-formylglutamate amidohydrolase n=1 Tax=Cavenderia fasciculata TaxID=261658 RepID=F4Q578_CACFS|nr:uncharacterized protein DFA_08119 [Cavenderia fasciculata]EGG17137.1 hypothetical protein DFA_08119 [Cavenderia fasciculata]|eukprot:XP_004355621.1 hypothetical protein DFA_08119 [Cavenderia fasciculata]